MSIAGGTVDTVRMAEDYWERRFRESNERAVLLAEASIPELVEMYHVSGEDIDFGSMVFEALQRRPHADLLAAALVERRARTVKRRDFAASLISMATDSAAERQANLPLLMAMLRDRSPRVVSAALQAMHSIQVSASGHALGVRLRTRPEDVPVEGWPAMPTILDLDALELLAEHPSSEVRESLARAMWLCGDTRAAALLLKLTRDDNEYVRGTAAYVFGEFRIAGGPMDGVIERLWEIADTDPTGARFDALAALVELGDAVAKARIEPELTAALDAGLQQGARYQLISLLWKDKDLVSDQLKDRLAAEWRVNFRAQAPSEMFEDD